MFPGSFLLSYSLPSKQYTGQQLCSILREHALLAYLCHQQKKGGQQQLENDKDEENKTTEVQC